MANINSMNVGGQLSIIEDTAAREMEANAYDPTQTYAKEDICIYNDKLYEANTAITTPEAFNIAHWTETTLGKIAQKHRDSISKLIEKIPNIHVSYYTILAEKVVTSTESTEYELYNGRKFSDHKGLINVLFKPGGSEYVRPCGSIPTEQLIAYKTISFSFNTPSGSQWVDVVYSSDTKVSVISSAYGNIWIYAIDTEILP